jgi:hypothetical protein
MTDSSSMTYETQKAQLPPTELGDERCLQIGYFGHGDIFIATWAGSLDTQPHSGDGISTCFNLAHGADLLLLASCIGYLRRINTPDEEIKLDILEASEEILADDVGDMRFHSGGNDHLAESICAGERFGRYDLPENNLSCLVPPRPAQPGLIYEKGGTAIYTRPNPAIEDDLVYASLLPDREEETASIHETADFSRADVPIIARLVCEMSLGEYRRDLRKLIGVQFLEEDYDL